MGAGTHVERTQWTTATAGYAGQVTSGDVRNSLSPSRVDVDDGELRLRVPQLRTRGSRGSLVSVVLSPSRLRRRFLRRRPSGAEDCLLTFGHSLECFVIGVRRRRPSITVCHVTPSQRVREMATAARTRLAPSRPKPTETIRIRSDIHASRRSINDRYWSTRYKLASCSR